MTSSAAELTPTAKNRSIALPSARRLLLWTGLAVLIAWVLVPIYLVALGAFGGRLGVFRWPKSIWPTDLSFAAMSQFLAIEGVFNALVNSLIAAGLTVVFSIALGAPAGYALARYTFRGQNAYRLLVLLTRAFPLAILALPLTVSFIRLGLYDTPFGVSLMSTRRLAFGNGRARNRTASITPKPAMPAPIASPRDMTAAATKPGLRRSERAATMASKARFCRRFMAK